MEELKMRGYDEYRFFYNDEVFPDQLVALEELLDGLESELDLFYRVHQVEARKRRDWDRLSELTWDVVDGQRRRGLRGFGGRLVRTTSSLDHAFIALAEFEGTNTLTSGVLRSAFNDTYLVDEPTFLQTKVEEEMETQQDYPSSQTQSLLQLFESRRLGRQELIVLVVSALIGGVAGGLISAITAHGQQSAISQTDAILTAPPPRCAPRLRFGGHCPVDPPTLFLTRP